VLEEFQQSSKELEAELEKEIESTERRCQEMKIRNESMRQEVSEWKVSQLQKIWVFDFLGETTLAQRCIGIRKKKANVLASWDYQQKQKKKGDCQWTCGQGKARPCLCQPKQPSDRDFLFCAYDLGQIPSVVQGLQRTYQSTDTAAGGTEEADRNVCQEGTRT